MYKTQASITIALNTQVPEDIYSQVTLAWLRTAVVTNYLLFSKDINSRKKDNAENINLKLSGPGSPEYKVMMHRNQETYQKDQREEKYQLHYFTLRLIIEKSKKDYI